MEKKDQKQELEKGLDKLDSMNIDELSEKDVEEVAGGAFTEGGPGFSAEG